MAQLTLDPIRAVAPVLPKIAKHPIARVTKEIRELREPERPPYGVDPVFARWLRGLSTEPTL